MPETTKEVHEFQFSFILLKKIQFWSSLENCFLRDYKEATTQILVVSPPSEPCRSVPPAIAKALSGRGSGVKKTDPVPRLYRNQHYSSCLMRAILVHKNFSKPFQVNRLFIVSRRIFCKVIVQFCFFPF